MNPRPRASRVSTDLDRMVWPFPSGPVAGWPLDRIRFERGKMRGRFGRWFRGATKTYPHGRLLRAALREVLPRWPTPVVLETGCIRDPDEGTDSTSSIAETLAGRGRFYAFELDPEHIETARRACGAHSDAVRFIEGDSVANLERLRGSGELDVVHLAFLDSADDPEHIWREFGAVEDAFPTGGLVIVDDAIRGVKGDRIRPALAGRADWETRLVFAGNGLLVAVRR